MRAAIVALTPQGAAVAERLRPFLDADVWLKKSALSGDRSLDIAREARTFDHLADVTGAIFSGYEATVFVMALGIVVRVISPHIKTKYTDPAVVVVDEGARVAISALSGHEGGANELALKVATALEAEPVITTASESRRRSYVGLGCRKGAPVANILAAIAEALVKADSTPGDVRYLATVEDKAREPGLLEASRVLDIPLRTFSKARINAANLRFGGSTVAARHLGVGGVCEPCSMLCSPTAVLQVEKQVLDGVTVAVSREMT